MWQQSSREWTRQRRAPGYNLPGDIPARHEASTIEPYVLIHEMEIVGTL